VAVFAGVGSAAAPPESPKTVFFRANGLYAEERYAEAAAQYEALVAAGLESGNLHFNLGNAYFKTGDVGRAILEYERARRWIPGDPDLAANLGHARSVAEVAEEPSVWTRLLFPFAGRFSTDALLLAASVLYTLLMLLLVAGRLVAPVARGARVAAAVAAAGLALLLPSVVYRLATVDLPTYAVVVARQDATVRFEPSAGGTVHFAAKPGVVLRVVGEREAWLQVMRSDGRRGWVERAQIATL
jgi:tetratricopeptide (TPR) repeat protein